MQLYFKVRYSVFYIHKFFRNFWNSFIYSMNLFLSKDIHTEINFTFNRTSKPILCNTLIPTSSYVKNRRQYISIKHFFNLVTHSFITCSCFSLCNYIFKYATPFFTFINSFGTFGTLLSFL